jgi:hypothetical protein
MKKPLIAVTLVAAGAVVATAFYAILMDGNFAPKPLFSPTMPAVQKPAPPAPLDTVGTEDKSGLIRVKSPKAGDVVTSPLVIEGEARGYWFFEASFPVVLEDGNGKVLASHYAEAQDEWMTENFVPFKATLDFTAPTSKTGTLILKKDNPSGLPEHDDEIRVLVRFP